MNPTRIDPHRGSQPYTRGIVVRAAGFTQTRAHTPWKIPLPFLLHPAHRQSHYGRPAFLNQGHRIPILVWPQTPGYGHGGFVCENG